MEELDRICKMGRNRAPRRIRQRQIQLALAGLGTYPGITPGLSQRYPKRPYFYHNPSEMKRCQARPLGIERKNKKPVKERLGTRQYDSFGFSAPEEDEPQGALSGDEDEEIEVIGQIRQEHSPFNSHGGVIYRELTDDDADDEENARIIEVCDLYSEEELENESPNDATEADDQPELIIGVTKEDVESLKIEVNLENSLRDLELESTTGEVTQKIVKWAEGSGPGTDSSPNTNHDHLEDVTHEERKANRFRIVPTETWHSLKELVDPDEFSEDIWVGTARDQKRAWLKRWPKTESEALEPLIDKSTKFTTASAHTKVCLKLMNTREHVENQNMKYLLFQAAKAHQKIVSFLHYGPEQDKNYVDEHQLDAEEIEQTDPEPQPDLTE